MEPSSVEDGNAVPVVQCHAVLLASMEPSSVEDGNVPPIPLNALRMPDASMEPSSVEDGNLSAVDARHAAGKRFNGAVLS